MSSLPAKSALPLKADGPLVKPFEWPMHPDNDPPRALKSLARIVDGDLCHRCGSCVGICPTDVLGLDKNEYPTVKNLSACTDCDLCVKVCPGTEFDVKSIAQQMFGFVPELTDMHGHFQAAYLSYSTKEEIRHGSTSGGLVTGLLISMLERDVIDGAIVIASDKKELWKGVPIVARTKEEILSAMKSKYAIAPTNAVFGEIRDIPGRYVLVGLPCQIHGFHKAARLDKNIRERVLFTIGLFCHAAVEHDPMNYIWERLGPKRENVTRFVSRIGKHPGTPHVFFKDGTSEPVYFPEKKGYRPSSMEILNVLYRTHTPQRCLTCYDSTSEFADIAVGDPWLPPPSDDIDFYKGYSFVLARTSRGQEALREVENTGDLALIRLKPETARTSNVMMGHEKRWRAYRVIETRRRQGHGVPDYGFETPRASGRHLKHFVLTEFNMLSHIACFVPSLKWVILRLTFSNFGYSLLWLNHQRRNFRTWRRDTTAWLRRKLLGHNPLSSDTEAHGQR